MTVDSRVARRVCEKNSQNYIIFTMEKVALCVIWNTFIIYQKYTYSRPKGENLPNLVTLVASLPDGIFSNQNSKFG
jgi:hypothetical protein